MEVLNNDRKFLAQCTTWDALQAACRLMESETSEPWGRKGYGVEKEALTGNYIVTISR